MIMILTFLKVKAFHLGHEFKEHMTKCFEDHITPFPEFKMTIGVHDLSENCYRALYAIYFDLLGEGMSGFSFEGSCDPVHCPWKIAGREYKSSDKLRVLRSARDEMEDGSSNGAENQRNKRIRIANDNQEECIRVHLALVGETRIAMPPA